MGRFRVENAAQKETLKQMEDHVRIADSYVNRMKQEMEAISKELQELNLIKTRCRELELEKETRQAELKANQDMVAQLRQQVFACTFDKFAYESNLRDNANLREHQKQMAQVMETMKYQFEEYVRHTGINPDDLRRREAVMAANEKVASG